MTFGEELDGALRRLQDHMNDENVSKCENECMIDSEQVKCMFLKLNAKKAVGPDNINGPLLKSCASQLCFVFSLLFNWSVNDCHVPRL